MGSFLDKPLTQHETDAAEGNDLKAGLACMQGWRVDMEDAHSITISLPDHPGYSWFAVYDGHGGKLAAKFGAERMLKYVTESAAWKADSATPESVKAAFHSGFLQADADLRKHSDVVSGEDHSGSTAITCLVTPTHFFVGNCGDSRAILVRGGEAVALSEDHKPYNELEQKRIEAAGGTVSLRRVNGDLAVSRALGDFVYKMNAAMSQVEQQVSPEPEMRVMDRDAAADQFLCLACDGVWDVMTNADVAAFLLSRWNEGTSNPVDLAGALIDEGLRLNSRDNMSAIVVVLRGVPAVDPEEAAKRKKERLELLAAAAATSAAAGSGSGGGPQPL